MNKPCSNNRVTDAAFLSTFFPNRTSSYIYFGRFCPKSSASNQKASNVLAMTPFLALFHSYPICMIWDMAFPPVVRSCSNISNSLLCRVIFFACCVHASRYTCICVRMQADNTHARKKNAVFCSFAANVFRRERNCFKPAARNPRIRNVDATIITLAVPTRVFGPLSSKESKHKQFV